MNVKRRLFLSNILMLAIPLLLAPLVAFSVNSLLWTAAVQNAGYPVDNPEQLFQTRAEVLQQANALLQQPADQRQPYRQAIAELLAKGNLQLEIYQTDTGRQIYASNQHTSSERQQLLDALQALGGTGTVSRHNQELYGEQTVVNGETYTLCLFSRQNWQDFRSAHSMMATAAVLVVAGMVLIILLTNRLLTRFVLRKIEQPLDILADGVHQIRDGNLDFRIQYHSQDEFTPICEDFNAMAYRLQQSVALSQKQAEDKKQLLAGISHDLRSPLTSIKAYVEGLLDGVAATPADQTRYMKMIKTKAEEIDHMVAKLFLFSKMDLGDFPYQPELLDLSQEIVSLVEATADAYASQGLRVHITQLAPTAALYVDPIQLRSVFTNILENSLKYKTKAQGNAWIKTVRQQANVWITIDDDGPGVPEEALEKLFDVFYRNDPSRSNPQQGSGLGLAITAKAIQWMRGSIHAENRQEGGLRLVIQLPLARKEQTTDEDPHH